jgi:thiol-disulfide isomerase/thioredoxin
VIDNASALVQVGGKHEQVYLGSLISVGDTWKLIDLPSLGPDQQPASPFMMAADAPTERAPANPGAPSEEMQKLMADLERLDKAAEGLPADQLAANVEQRLKLLNQLADATPDSDIRGQWFRQMTDMLFVAAQSGNFPQGIERLEQLEKRLKDASADEDLQAHATFQRMWAGNAVAQAQPGADSAKLQEKWLGELEQFVTSHPKSPDSAEGLLQLGMFQEFNGKIDEARKWYTMLVTNFPQAASTKKARGALQRLSSVGRPIQLRGQSMQGGTVDLAAYRGKVVLIQFWATWAEHSKEDMILLKDFYAKNAGRGFDIVGVNLDDSAAPAKQFLNENKLMWKQMREEGGLDGRLANELGVMTVPLMILVDAKGNVVNDNIHVAELDTELNKLLAKPEGDANALRQPPNPQR